MRQQDDKTPGELVTEAMDARLLDLGLSQRRLAVKAGVSPETIRQARQGRPMKTHSEGRLDRALGWQPGHGLSRVRAGLAPEPLADDNPTVTFARPSTIDVPLDPEVAALPAEIREPLVQVLAGLRRLANHQTVPAAQVVSTEVLRVVGELNRPDGGHRESHDRI